MNVGFRCNLEAELILEAPLTRYLRDSTNSSLGLRRNTMNKGKNASGTHVAAPYEATAHFLVAPDPRLQAFPRHNFQG